MPLLSHFCFDNRAIIAELQNTQEIERQSYTLASKIENIKKQLKETPDNEKLKKTLESMESTLQTIHENPQAYQLKKVQKSLQEIYFKQGQSRADIQKELLSPRFNDFPQLKDLLHQIFSNEEVITLNLTLQDKQAIQSFAELNAKYGYFNEDVDELYQSLAASCYKMTALIEGQASDDEMAYKLMALFYSKDCQTPEKISAAFNQFTGQITHPYHFVFITELNQFPPQKLKWQEFIHKNGMAALKIFAQHQAFETVPESLEIAQAILFKKKYPRAEENKALAQLCKKLLISNQGFEAGLEFIQTGFPKKTSDHLPIVDIADETGQYLWVKLPPQDLRALYLGNLIPDCCQFINGHSAQCVKDGMSLSDNGFYVLLKAKKPNTSAERIINSEVNDKDFDIVAQSYAWLSMNGNLCLDSIEWHRERVSLPVIQELMEKFSQDIFSHSDIKHLNVGRGGQTPQRIYRPSPINEGMRQGYQYRDSEQQFKIKSNMRPEQEKALQERLKSYPKDFQEMILYIAPYFADIEQIPQALVAINPNIVQVLDIYLSKIKLPPQLKPEDFRAITFKQFQEMTPEEQSKVSTFCKIFNMNPKFENSSTHSEIAIAENLKWLSTISNDEYVNIPHNYYIDFDILNIIEILKHIPKDRILNIIEEKDKNSNTILQRAISNPDSLETILHLLPEEQRLKAILQRNSSGNALLHEATKNPLSLRFLLNLLPEEQRLKAVLEERKDRFGNTLLDYAFQNPELLKVILNLLPEKQRLEAVLKKDNYRDGYTFALLNYTAQNLELLKIILNLLPSEQRLELMQMTVNQIRDSRIFYDYERKLLEEILELLPAEQRLAAIQTNDRFGYTLLYRAAENPKPLHFLFNLLPEEHRLEALLNMNKDGDTVLHIAAKSPNPQSLQFLLNLLPEEQRPKAILQQNSSGNTLLHEAIKNPQSLHFLINLMPEEQRLEALLNMNKDGDTVLHIAAKSPQSLQFLLNLLPEEHRLEAILQQNSSGNTLLHEAIKNPQSLHFLINLMPEEQRLEAILKQNSSGNTLLHEAAEHLQSLQFLLNRLEEQSPKAILQENSSGNTLLHEAIKNPKSLQFLLNLLPEDQRPKAILQKNSSGNTLLHEAAENPKLLIILLTLLPEEQRLKALLNMNKVGDTVLHIAAKNPLSFQTIIDVMPYSISLAIHARENDIKDKTEGVNESIMSIQDLMNNLKALDIPSQEINAFIEALVSHKNIKKELKNFLYPKPQGCYIPFFSRPQAKEEVQTCLDNLHPFWKTRLTQELSPQAFRKT